MELQRRGKLHPECMSSATSESLDWQKKMWKKTDKLMIDKTIFMDLVDGHDDEKSDLKSWECCVTWTPSRFDMLPIVIPVGICKSYRHLWLANWGTEFWGWWWRTGIGWRHLGEFVVPTTHPGQSTATAVLLPDVVTFKSGQSDQVCLQEYLTTFRYPSSSSSLTSLWLYF